MGNIADYTQDILKILKGITENVPMEHDEYMGDICSFCAGKFQQWTGEFTHNEDCLYVDAKELIQKITTTQQE